MGSSSSKKSLSNSQNTIVPATINPVPEFNTVSSHSSEEMPLAKIEWIRVFEDGKVGISVFCGKCKRNNKHQLHRTTKNSMFVQIDFDKLDTRCCPSRGCGDYNLY